MPRWAIRPLTDEQRNLVAANLGLAEDVVWRYVGHPAARRCRASADEIRSAAYLGLTLAARSFQKQLGVFGPHGWNGADRMVRVELGISRPNRAKRGGRPDPPRMQHIEEWDESLAMPGPSDVDRWREEFSEALGRLPDLEGEVLARCAAGEMQVSIARSMGLDASTMNRIYRQAIVAVRAIATEDPEIACACGCGRRLLRYDSAGRPRRFVPGHNPKPSPMMDRILGLIGSMPTRKSEIVDASGLHRNVVGTYLTKLKRAGKVIHVEHGLWARKPS